jgi:flagellar biosynthetic protein FlhB
MAESAGEKTEAPTPRRLSEARESGNVARSTDLTAAATLLAAVIVLNFMGLRVMQAMRLSLEAMISASLGGNPTRTDDLGQLVRYGGGLAIAAVGPITLSIAAVALLAALMQTGIMFTAKPLQPNLNKLNPLKGVAQMFNARAGMRLVMSLAKLAALAVVSAWVIHSDLPRIAGLSLLEPMPILAAVGVLVYDLALKLAALLLILAILDYWFQKWQHVRELRMTKEEVKEEMKRMEGDPLMKQRRARVARQLALQRIASSVPHADVVVTNPTHFAIAIKYDSEKMTAPKVVAKGADFMAMRIRQIAMTSGVPLVERKELARALYKSVEVGQEVPPEFYAAVAEILAYVYRLSGRQVAAAV